MEPFRQAQRPVVMGHRGAPVSARENTPAAFAAAARAGATWVELDVRRSADDVVVVHHDAWADDGCPIVELTLPQLHARQVWALADVLAQLPPGLGVDVELKNLPGEPDYEEAEALVGLLTGLLDTTQRPMMASSFNPATVAALHERVPDVPVGLLTTSGLRAEAGVVVAAELEVQVYCPQRGTPDLDASAVRAAHEAGLAVLVWTVDDPDEAVALAEVGVDAVCTNDPAALVRALG